MPVDSGDNSHGFRNEENIVNSLNGKRYKDLNLNMKTFVDYICECEGIDINIEMQVKSKIETDNKKKQDLYIELAGKNFGISVKMGSGNSTHQEKCEDFISYIKHDYDASKTICDDIRIFTWCDGTLDGSGRVSDRMDKAAYLAAYATGIQRIRGFLKEHEKELIERILFVGRHNSKVDYIYHGTPLNGKWISSKALIEYQMKNPLPLGSALARIGRMTLQVWNRSLIGNSDQKRGQLQVKYGTMEDDLNAIMHSTAGHIGTFHGDQEEYSISKLMNKNKQSQLWTTVGHRNDNQNMYLIKVAYNAYSILAQKKVKAKTDAYVVEINLDDRVLLEKEYTLTEDDIADKTYRVVPNTGISVKMKDSDSFTYEKLSLNSFVRMFDAYFVDPKMIFCGLTLYQEDKNIKINADIVKNLGYEVEEVEKEMLKHTDNGSVSIYDKSDVKAFRTYCENKLRDVIENSQEIKEMIFTGKGCFEAPYFIDYIYKAGTLSKNAIPNNYQITNGSGRSKGNYTIIFKPL